MSGHLLTITLLLPLFGAVALALVSRIASDRDARIVALFLALDLLLFFLFFEALLVPMYLIIGGWGSGNRVYAAIKFFLFTMAGSAFLLVGILFLYAKSGQAGPATFDGRQLTLVAASLPV